MPGRWIRMSATRRFTNDLLAISHGIPTVPVQRVMHVAPLVEARAAVPNRPCWPAIFLKAYARVSDRTPELRRAYVGLPWPHLREYPKACVSIAVEREIDGELGILYGKITAPAERSLLEVHARVRRYAEAPLSDVKAFRSVFRLAYVPRFLRRLGLWLALNTPGMRPKFCGTFGLTVYSALGAESLHPIAPVTTTLTYGVIDADGRVSVRLIYDHRVLDGSTVARALGQLEAELNGAILQEMRSLASARHAA